MAPVQLSPELSRVESALVSEGLAPIRTRPPEQASVFTNPDAAVAIVLREAAERPLELLLIRRAENNLDPWSGHMALPGGRREPADEDLVATAVRETQEEVGLDLGARGRLLGGLRSLPAIARGAPVGFAIVPFVFGWLGAEEPRTGPEVAEALWVPLATLMVRPSRTSVRIASGLGSADLPAWDFEGRIIWGLTYRILLDLFAVFERQPAR